LDRDRKLDGEINEYIERKMGKTERQIGRGKASHYIFPYFYPRDGGGSGYFRDCFVF
jgi:hypothetical protein